jgi:hypothetical protein
MIMFEFVKRESFFEQLRYYQRLKWALYAWVYCPEPRRAEEYMKECRGCCGDDNTRY